jgi:hypothetical protein
MRYRWGEVLARAVGGCWVGEDLKLWLRDQAFFGEYRRLSPRSPRAAERVFAVRELVRSLSDVEGDTAECGVFQGTTSFFICQARGRGPHHVFDSFAGLSAPSPEDDPEDESATKWRTGDFAAPEILAKRNLAEFPFVRFYPGWIPERFPEVADRSFCFVHIDVDLYEPTRDSLEFFFPRVVHGGMIVCDDYGFANCPGAHRACDEFAVRGAARLVHLPTGQGLFLKA